AAAAMVVVVLVPKYVPLAWQHLQLLYWQRQALHYSLPADVVTYESDSAEAPKLIASHDYFSNGGEAMRIARPWERFYMLLSPPGRLPQATLFLREVRNQKGEFRLVVVEGDIVGVSSGANVNVRGDLAIRMRPTVIRPGSLFSTPVEASASSRQLIL